MDAISATTLHRVRLREEEMSIDEYRPVPAKDPMAYRPVARLFKRRACSPSR